ncbi:type 1 glutamine amidotransferase [Paenibacillus rhizovicinus]|uniref:Type 1 glutamine amidotransferase n=1 Tax=Paenibacillus rhizovicinus TaxID=2704463 RepID=A0A6C0NZY0_9BACL|nr:type 1 glutamine amidotransferase [Paenibacillus rhizovicinus]QHW31830.1 type 1 glutamine amidotransferase [Paenibacillus rhizovicinus]
MNILVCKHFAFDDESALAAWAERQGHALRVLLPAELAAYPVQESFDMLVILGGPMSVYEEARYPWLIGEKRFVRDCIDAGKPVLGICLGAQMLSEVLGGVVYRNDRKEIGWHAVQRTEERHPCFEGVPQSFTSFQWHGDTFTLPEGAVRLASSEACGNQAFAYGETVLALQFHLETTPVCIGTMLSVWASELTEAPFIQPAAEIAAQTERSEASHALLAGILDRLAAAAAATAKAIDCKQGQGQETSAPQKPRTA